jgi:hypothetical protein
MASGPRAQVRAADARSQFRLWLGSHASDRALDRFATNEADKALPRGDRADTLIKSLRRPSHHCAALACSFDQSIDLSLSQILSGRYVAFGLRRSVRFVVADAVSLSAKFSCACILRVRTMFVIVGLCEQSPLPAQSTLGALADRWRRPR